MSLLPLAVTRHAIDVEVGGAAAVRLVLAPESWFTFDVEVGGPVAVEVLR